MIDQPGQEEFKEILAERERIYQLYQSKDFQTLLLPYLNSELANRSTELVFDTFKTEEERGVCRGKAQALYAVINLPDELKQLKSLQDISEHKKAETEPDE
jgi:hypothetical protein